MGLLDSGTGPGRTLGSGERDNMVWAVIRPREREHQAVCQAMPVRRRRPGGGVEGVAPVVQDEAETAAMPPHGELMLTS